GLDSRSHRVTIEAEPSGFPLTEGRACLTAHDHSPDFAWRENFQVRGDLVRSGDGWSLVPHRLVGGIELPNRGFLGRYRETMRRSIRFHRTARRELRKRRRN